MRSSKRQVVQKKERLTEKITMMKSMTFQDILRYDSGPFIMKPYDMILVTDSITKKLVITISIMLST